MALALSDFGALCGFLPTFQVSEYLSAVPEFASLLPNDIVQHFKSVARSPEESERKLALRDLFSSFMKVDDKTASSQLKCLVERYQAGKETDAEKQVKSLVLRLHEMYPEDRGVFCAFIMNHYELKPGHAFTVAAGEPHAYITGGKKLLQVFENVLKSLSQTLSNVWRHLTTPSPLLSPLQKSVTSRISCRLSSSIRRMANHLFSRGCSPAEAHIRMDHFSITLPSTRSRSCRSLWRREQRRRTTS